MRVLNSFILLIAVGGWGSSAHLHGERERERVSPIIWYWYEELPMTPIPQTLRQIISSDDDDDKIALNVGEGGVKVGGREGCNAWFFYGLTGKTPQMAREESACTVLVEKDLVSGTKVSLTFVQEKERHFLPRGVAEEIPFSSDKISVALKEVSVAEESEMGVAMKETLQECESPAVEGESRFCATSLESMIDYTTSRLGSNRLTVVATNVPKRSESVKEEYTIVGVKYEGEEEGEKVVCHSVEYAYAVYKCHELKGVKVARVWVKGGDGRTVEAAAVCHTNTSGWSPKHPALQALKVKPGVASVCHFIPQNHLVWLPE